MEILVRVKAFYWMLWRARATAAGAKAGVAVKAAAAAVVAHLSAVHHTKAAAQVSGVSAVMKKMLMALEVGQEAGIGRCLTLALDTCPVVYLVLDRVRSHLTGPAAEASHLTERAAKTRLQIEIWMY